VIRAPFIAQFPIVAILKKSSSARISRLCASFSSHISRLFSYTRHHFHFICVYFYVFFVASTVRGRKIWKPGRLAAKMIQHCATCEVLLSQTDALFHSQKGNDFHFIPLSPSSASHSSAQKYDFNSKHSCSSCPCN